MYIDFHNLYSTKHQQDDEIKEDGQVVHIARMQEIGNLFICQKKKVGRPEYRWGEEINTWLEMYDDNVDSIYQARNMVAFLKTEMNHSATKKNNENSKLSGLISASKKN